jgi:hypothetical protein
LQHLGGGFEPGDRPVDVQRGQRRQYPPPASLDQEDAILFEQLECFAGSAAPDPAERDDLGLAGHAVAGCHVPGHK